MDASLFISKTGLDAQQRRMSVISNNLANVSTTGFKRERAVFEDFLLAAVLRKSRHFFRKAQITKENQSF